MLIRIIALFIIIPLIDLAILIALGRYVGVWQTIAAIVVIGIIGAVIAQRQGFNAINSIRAELQIGHIPSAQLWDGLFIVIGGVLLITPGIITDILALLCLLPKSRATMKKATILFLKRRLLKRIR
ncbi:FxsA family protein [Mahella sp.]|uniref:FxsA family protein n=1 Tax=Mahella sp. TaxID=2798721 RepID=UPI0025C563E3|nr:FxsA family protein [Mahella sp.]MBZ4666638.1 FxsA cytoplasmic rane protein [Mahella sp.]